MLTACTCSFIPGGSKAGNNEWLYVMLWHTAILMTMTVWSSTLSLHLTLPRLCILSTPVHAYAHDPRPSPRHPTNIGQHLQLLEVGSLKYETECSGVIGRCLVWVQFLVCRRRTLPKRWHRTYRSAGNDDCVSCLLPLTTTLRLTMASYFSPLVPPPLHPSS